MSVWCDFGATGKDILYTTWTKYNFVCFNLYMTHNQLNVTFDGQNHRFSKYAIFNTFKWKNIGMVTECHIGMESYKKFRFFLLDFRF